MPDPIDTDDLRRMLEAATPGPWRLGADLTTINTAYGSDADFVKGGWAKAIAKTTLPKWMPPKQAWPNGELIALAPQLAAENLALRADLSALRAREAEMRAALHGLLSDCDLAVHRPEVIAARAALSQPDSGEGAT